MTLTHGTNRLIGTDPEAIVSMARQALRESCRSSDRPPLWDGLASERIVDKLEAGRPSKKIPIPPPSARQPPPFLTLTP